MKWSGRANERDWGDLRPRRNCESETDEHGTTRLLMPRYGRGRLADWLRRRVNPRPVRIRLDEIGVFVWRHCDGTNTVERIAEAMRAEFGERAEPVEQRLVLFLRKLIREKLLAVGPN